jgi:hypothetical protein
VDENFFAQAEGENTRAQYLLRKAPFLVPFTDRVRIYTVRMPFFADDEIISTGEIELVSTDVQV